MLTKLHRLSQQVRWVACILTVLFLQNEYAFAFESQIAKKTSGDPYPHILKKETFTINTRSIKALKENGKYLWIGTSNGLLRYDTQEQEEIEIYDNTNKLLSNGIFSIAIDKKAYLG